MFNSYVEAHSYKKIPLDLGENLWIFFLIYPYSEGLDTKD